MKNMFKDYFKYYKSRNPLPTFENVLDIENPAISEVSQLKKPVQTLPVNHLGLQPVSSWEIYEFSHIPGLTFIKNPFTPAGQRLWITRCLKHYSKKPNKLNIDAHNLLQDNETWWDVCTNDNKRAISLIPKLRWATMGYHHNWNTKHYSEESKTDIPQELADLSKILVESVGFTNFIAEAAIINYYRMNSTLAGHVDHSEANMEAPLASISFGQTAIFLIGGLKSEDPANPIFLKSGDVIIMSGPSRLKYHGVPKILPAKTAIWDCNDQDNSINLDNLNDWNKARCFISETRINMNIRQVLKIGQSSLLSNM